MKRLTGFALLILGLILLGCGEQTSQQALPIETERPVTVDIPQETVGTPEAEDVDVITVPVSELTVSAEDGMPDLETLRNMTSLRFLDLTALPYTDYSVIAAISETLPACRIIWNQMLTDGVFRSDAADLILPNAGADDIGLLKAFSNLRSVDATGSSAYAELFAFQNANPGIDVRYSYHDGTTVLSNKDETLTVPIGVNADALTDAVQYFPDLKEVDLRESDWTDVQVESFCGKNPGIAVDRMIVIGDSRYDSDTEVLNLNALTGWSPTMLIAKLSAFSKLKAIGLPSEWSEQDNQTAAQAMPGVQIVGKIARYGKEIDCAAEELDLSDTKLGGMEDVESLIVEMPFLKKLIVCNCGLSDDQMVSLADAHPEIRFVWIITLGPHKLRTDAVGFSTKNPSKHTNPKASDAYNKKVKNTKRLHEGDIALLKYCSDLEALDLGHNYLTNNDLNVIAGLTKLKVLILADNMITDISALTTLKDLEYIELFMNKIPDLSPLTEMPSLQDINVCNVGVSDLSPLFSLTGVKRLWYAMNPFSKEQAAAVKEALPDCLCNYTTKDETAEGWREDPRYFWMRSYFN